jgi:hypothetical protein
MTDLREGPEATGPLTAGRHPVNIGHLVMGLAFLCFVACWVIVKTRVVTGDDLHWLLPIPWVVAGAGGLTAMVVTGVRRRRR